MIGHIHVLTQSYVSRRAVFETHRDGEADFGEINQLNERVDQRRKYGLDWRKYHVDCRRNQVLDKTCNRVVPPAGDRYRRLLSS